MYSKMIIAAFAWAGVVVTAWAGARAEDSTVEIIAPMADASIFIDRPYEVKYKATLAGKGDRIELFLDDQKQVRLRQLEGSYVMEKLPIGLHEICIKVMDKKNQPTGDQDCVEYMGTVPKGWR
jgi:hypothetical protein